MADDDLGIILPLEQTLQGYVAGFLPAGFGVYCAHEAQLIPGTDYVVIQSGRPGGPAIDDGVNECLVEFQVYTGEIEDDDRRLGAVALHDQRCGLVERLWHVDQFAAALVALNAAGAARGIGFTGWAPPDDAPGEDGSNGAQLISKIRRVFVCHWI